jgi:hypothetical protein
MTTDDSIDSLDRGRPGTPLSYAEEKFSTAVYAMAVSEAPLRQRIRQAHESFCAVGEEDFPEGSSALSDYRALMARTTWAENKGQGTIPATLAVISDLECRRLAQLICDVHSGIQADVCGHTRNALYAAQKRIRELTGETQEPLNLWLDEDSGGPASPPEAV